MNKSTDIPEDNKEYGNLFSIVSEMKQKFGDDLGGLKEDHKNLETRLEAVEGGITNLSEASRKDSSDVMNGFEKLRADNATFRADVTKDLGALGLDNEKLRTNNETFRADVTKDLGALRLDNEKMRTEISAGFVKMELRSSEMELRSSKAEKSMFRHITFLFIGVVSLAVAIIKLT